MSSSRYHDVIVSCAFLGGAALLWLETSRDQYATTGLRTTFTAVFFPRFLIVVIAVLALIILVRSLVRKPEVGDSSPGGGRRLLGFVIVTGLYAAGVSILGFAIATWIYVPAMLFLLGYRRPLVFVPVSLLTSPIAWYFFQHLLQIQLPTSPWSPYL